MAPELWQNTNETKQNKRKTTKTPTYPQTFLICELLWVSLFKNSPSAMAWMFVSPQSSYFEIPPPKVVLGGGASEKWLIHDGSLHEWD